MCTRILKFDFVWDGLLDACDGAIYLGKSSPFFNPSAPPWATVKLWTYVTCTFVGVEKPKESASGRAKNTVPCGTSKPHDRKQDEKGRDRQASKKASSMYTLFDLTSTCCYSITGKKSFLQTREMWPPKMMLIVHIGSKNTLIAMSLALYSCKLFLKLMPIDSDPESSWATILHPAEAFSLFLVSAANCLGLPTKKRRGTQSWPKLYGELGSEEV